MRCVVVLLALLSASCRHEFPAPTTGDANEHDPDAALPLDHRLGQEAERVDRLLRDAPPNQCAKLSGSADCAKEESWTCAGICEGKHQYACAGAVQREIRCPELGLCECYVGGALVATCAFLDNGRFGCDRCLEALRQGCCKP